MLIPSLGGRLEKYSEIILASQVSSLGWKEEHLLVKKIRWNDYSEMQSQFVFGENKNLWIEEIFNGEPDEWALRLRK